MALNKALKQAAYQILSRREHSRQELTRKLLDKDYQAEEVSDLVTRLEENDIQSDYRFADMIFRSRVNKGYGWLYIKQELRHKGVNDEIINELTKNHEIDWYLQAELAYNKRFDLTNELNDKEKAKRVRFMQNRGFTLEQTLILINQN
jgi:regulatory protein